MKVEMESALKRDVLLCLPARIFDVLARHYADGLKQHGALP